MKILLTLPPSDALTITPPLGLGYIAAVLRANHYEDVVILDPQKEQLGMEKFFARVMAYHPDIIGLSVLTSNYTKSKSIIQRLKRDLPRTLTVVGGPHASALPEATLEETQAHFLIKGEGEYTFLKLVQAVVQGGEDWSGIPNLCYRKNGRLVRNPDTTILEDLDQIPFPAWDLIRPDQYPMKPHQFFFNRFPIAPVITSRGCPFGCSFCASGSLAGRRLRRRSAKNVVDEIEMLVRTYGVKEIHFEDDNFTLVKEHAMGICEEIIARKLNIVWQSPNGIRVDSVDQELIGVMKKSGCYRLAFGIESGSQEILDRVDKRLDLNRVKDVIQMVKRAGIETHGFFILGLPGETHKTIRRTKQLIRELPLDFVNAALLAYLPGSRLFEEKFGTENCRDLPWENFQYFIAQPTEHLSAESLKQYQKSILRSFYLNPKKFFHLARSLKLKQLKYFYEGVFKYTG